MRTVLFDVDTQIDFLYPAGALYVPGAESILPSLARLHKRAFAQGWPLVSTTDAHSENDPEFRNWPAHCVVGTIGQTKPPALLHEQRVVVPNKRADFVLPPATQVILEKTELNCFTNPNLAGLLLHYDADRYIVFGLVTEICVKFAALGLLETGKKVELVHDAVMHLDRAARDAMLGQFTAAGGRLTSTSEICG